MIALDKNEIPFDLSKKQKQEIAALLVEQEWNRYPSMFNNELRQSIAEHSKLPKERVFIGNGSSGIIQHLITIYKNKYNRLVFANPSFELFYKCSNIYEIEQVLWTVNDNMQYDYENFPSQEGSIYFLCNPNNPSGELIDPNFIELQIQEDPNSIFIIDEAYNEFSGKSLMHLTNKYENTIILRTLSKAFGLAGMRLGWATCHEKTAEFLTKNEIPFRLNHFTMILGKYIFDHYDEIVVPTIKKVVAERKVMHERLLQLFKGTKNQVFPSFGNFLLIKSEIKNLIEQLSDQNIRIGRVKNFSNYYRVTIGTTEQNISCFEGLKFIMTSENKHPTN